MYYVNSPETSPVLLHANGVAVTYITLHVTDAVKQGHNSLLIHTGETNIVVLAVTLEHHLDINELCIDFLNYKKEL